MARRVMPLALSVCVGLTTAASAATRPTPVTPTCDPALQCCASNPGTGSTCGGVGVASQGNSSGTDQGAGNPINVITGNKYQREADLPALPGVLGLEIVRHYNSALSGISGPRGILGRGWKLSYETALRVTPGSGNSLVIEQADGTRATFVRGLGVRDTFFPADSGMGRVVRRSNSPGFTYQWQWANGRQLDFDQVGHLVNITVPTGEFVSLNYDAEGLLYRVTDPQGRTLSLHYADASNRRPGDPLHGYYRGVQDIDTPVGRFNYHYGSPAPAGSTVEARQLQSSLVRVDLPTRYNPDQPAHPHTSRGTTASAISRLYHYEDAAFPTLLTGISVRGQGSDGQLVDQRVGAYGYDRAGRANLSVRGEPARLETGKDGKPLQPPRLAPGTGIEQVTLEFRGAPGLPGETIVTNSLAQATTYRHTQHNGKPRLLEVRGAGCAACGPPNMRYGYDHQGRLVDATQLSLDGKPLRTTHTEFDGAQRVRQISTIAWMDGKPQPPQWRVRYDYPAYALRTPQEPDPLPPVWPSIISRPSVLPGKEHQLRIAYNEMGQPLDVEETGFSPLDDAGKRVASATGGAPAVIRRATRHAYQVINRRSLLVGIDGPLPNGPLQSPQDSDITTLEWDKSGSTIVAVTLPGGLRSRLQTDPAGRPVEVTDADNRRTRLRYDPLGHLLGFTRTSPGVAQPVVQSFQYDAYGNAVERGSGGAGGNEAGRDAEVPDYRPQQHVGSDWLGRQTWQASALGILQQRRYDTESRLVETAALDGNMRRSLQVAWDSMGRLASLRDNSGALLRLQHDDAGRVTAWTDALGREHPARAASQHTLSPRTLQDDFGRPVATISPDSGITTRSFDDADRLIGSSDALGNRAQYTHDAMNRIQYQVITPADLTATGSTTRWFYRGQRLAGLEHPEQSERFQYDPAGRLASRAVTIRAFDGRQRTSITRYDHDDDGQLRRTSLPDGSWLRVQRNGQGQVIGLVRSRIGTAWLGWLLPSQTIVSDIERDLVGPRRLVTGNGVEARFQRSREGVLARVLHGPLARSGDRANDRIPLPGARAATPPLAASPSASPFTPATSATTEAAAAASTGASASPPQPGLTPVRTDKPAALPGALGLPADPAALLDYRYLWDTQGNLLHTQGKASGGAPDTGYAWDGRDRLIAAANASDVSRFLYDRQGNRLLSQQGIKDQRDLTAGTVRPAWRAGANQWLAEGAVHAEWDASGQPERIGTRHYQWDALGKLVKVRQERQATVHYAYNHRGERIRKDDGTHGSSYLYEQGKLSAELDEHGRITRQYLYLADQPIAVLDTPNGVLPDGEERSVLAQVAADIAIAFHAWFSDDEQLAFLHANHLGAIEVATAADGTVLWRAQYGPFGQVLRIGAFASPSSGNRQFRLRLRLPGQYEDEETGLYYNGQRYYDPQRGRYLTPDPLGTPDGPNGYAYVRGNPLRYVDPDGLILFAFDGTGNDERNPATVSNVVKFRDLYNNGAQFYITGPGTKDPKTGIQNPIYKGGDIADVIESFTGKERVAAMVAYLDKVSDNTNDENTLDIDITGFSRGAAEARDFANDVAINFSGGYYRYKDNDGKDACQKVNLRFIGLFDTVLSTHAGSYHLGIPDAFNYVVQAVALNEYRGSLVAFHSESILGASAAGNDTRIERGFLGSHSDIGGSFPDGDLSKIALVWMVDQAVAAGVAMKPLSISETAIVPDPVLHDKSSNLLNAGPGPGSEDRDVRSLDGTIQKQRKANTPGMTWADTTQFITYRPNPNSRDDISGTVNVKDYLQWLDDHGYNIDMEVQ
jgi:RHS repeat-associated protein